MPVRRPGIIWRFAQIGFKFLHSYENQKRGVNSHLFLTYLMCFVVYLLYRILLFIRFVLIVKCRISAVLNVIEIFVSVKRIVCNLNNTNRNI